MRLQYDIAPVNQAAFAETTRLQDGTLTVNREELSRLLAVDTRLRAVEVHLANPGEECRIVDVFDVIEPRCKVDGRVNFPGVIEPLARVGDGRTRVLRGAAVVVLSALPDLFKTVIDMSGEAAQFIPYARTANVCIAAQPAAGVERVAYYRALKEAAVKAGTFLARAVADTPVHATEIYDLDRPTAEPTSSSPLPRVAYVFMLASHQVPTEADEPILYGDNVRHLLPTVLHPNEVLDGAVLAPYWYLGTETYFIQNHPVILDLYHRHGLDLEFAGVVAIVAHVTDAERRRSVVMAANLVKETLRADGVLLTKTGGGIPESDLMSMVDACEGLGMRTTVLVWTHRGDGRTDGSLTFISPRADALVSVGMHEEPIDLPPVKRVIGGSLVSPPVSEPDAEARPANGALRLRLSSLAGVINQLGAGRLSIEEY
ncbi:MAG TPA: glycine/sarcosine/betaine reductase component B subunit [Candidatus Binatia bacterium]|jgi:glycine reductase|nr:glycine/sarcosine/betaine reductase component B subunit [Candidatus Binatia bacterium]